jgi:hypothetical protein
MLKNYLQHDFGSRNNPILLQIRRKHGMEGVGIYWSITEQLFELGGEMQLDYDLLSYDLRSDVSTISGVVSIAFQVENGKIFSEVIISQLNERLEAYNKKVEGRSKAGIASGIARREKAKSIDQPLNKDEQVFDVVKQDNSSDEQNELSKEKKSIVKLSNAMLSEDNISYLKISKAMESNPILCKELNEYKSELENKLNNQLFTI